MMASLSVTISWRDEAPGVGRPGASGRQRGVVVVTRDGGSFAVLGDRGLRGLRLVALADARAYWWGVGFDATPALLPAAYGAGAVFMRRG